MKRTRSLVSWLFWIQSGVIDWVGWPLRYSYKEHRENGTPHIGAVQELLIICVNEIGDMVLASPFLRECRRVMPQARITLVVARRNREMVEPCPYVDRIVSYDTGVSRYARVFVLPWRGRQLAKRYLNGERFDLALLPRWDTDTYYATFLAYFSGARRRVGYSESVSERKRVYNRGWDRLLTDVVSCNLPRHEVENNLGLIEALGEVPKARHLEIWMSTEDEKTAERILTSNGISPADLLVAICPGAGVEKKMWPVENFAEVGEQLWAEGRVRMLVLGGRKEEPLGRELRARIGAAAVNLVGQTTVRETGALLKRCHLYLGNDTGAKHVAAAVGIPVIEVSCHPQDGLPLHETSPARFGPWGVPHQVLRPPTALAPCVGACSARHAHCIKGVAISEVQSAVLRQLRQCGATGWA